jgi:putative ABC transport system ATP-binding protein
MIELINVSKSFCTNGYSIVALDNISVKIEDNDYVQVRGPNGSGKTTLLNVISGAEIPDKGKVFFEGKEITYLQEYRRNFISRIFQDSRYASCDHISILHTLCLAQFDQRPSFWRKAINDNRREMVFSVLKNACLNSLIDRINEPLENLSGGERQVINVLFLNLRRPMPRLILADEPTNHLDPENANHVRNLLSNLSNYCSIILVSHEKEIAPGVKKIITMEKGRFINDPSD